MTLIPITYGTYNFNAPIPLISISADRQRDGAGRVIGGTLSINIEGKLCLPQTGVSVRELLIAESGLRSAFSKDGYNLIIGSEIYSGIKVSRYATNKTEDNWSNKIDYSIDLISEIFATGNNSGCYLVSSTEDNWSIDATEEFSYATPVNLTGIGFSGLISGTIGTGVLGDRYPIYRVSRTLGAVGKYQPSDPTGYQKSALDNAAEWVNDHINNFSINNIVSGLTLYNFNRNISKSDTDGSYRITDSWLAAPTGMSPYTESFTIDRSLDSSMIRTVTINGTVKGLETFIENNYKYPTGSLSGGIIGTNISHIMDSKFNNAISGYMNTKPSIYFRAQQFATTGIRHPLNFGNQFNRRESPLNPIPATFNETLSPTEGSITYSYSYSNRPKNAITGSITENISMNDTFATPVVASLFTLFRPQGPIIQDLNTITVSTREVRIEASFPKIPITQAAYPPPQQSDISGLLEKFNPKELFVNLLPNGSKYIKSYEKSNSFDWNIMDNKMTASKTWEWQISYTRQDDVS